MTKDQTLLEKGLESIGQINVFQENRTRKDLKQGQEEGWGTWKSLERGALRVVGHPACLSSLCPPQPRSVHQPLWDASTLPAQFPRVTALWMFNQNLVQTLSLGKWSHH